MKGHLQSEDFASAFVSSLIAKLMVAPMDTIRVRRTIYTKSVGAALYRNLYAGLPISLILSVPGTSAFLLTYGAVRAEWGHIVAATAAEMVAGVFFVPMEVVKQRQQLGTAGYNHGVMVALASTPRRELWRGYVVSLFSFVPFSVGYFSLYESLCRNYGGGTLGLDARRHFAFSIFSAACAGAATTPLDAVRIRYQASSGSMWGVISNAWKREGPRFLVQGMGPR